MIGPMDPDLYDWSENFDLTGAAAWVFFGVMAVVWVIGIAAYVAIIRKAGYSGWWILIMLLPVVNIVMFLAFAFAEWPVQRALRAARGAAQGSPGGYPAQIPGPPGPDGPPPPGWR